MNTKWTPGKWLRKASVDTNETIIWNDNLCPIAKIPWPGFTENNETEANARLIAAAPELAEALQALDKAFWPAANGWGDDIQDAIQEAHTLLAKLELAPTETHGKKG